MARHRFTGYPLPGSNNIGLIKFRFEMVLLQQVFNSLTNVLYVVRRGHYLTYSKLTIFYHDHICV